MNASSMVLDAWQTALTPQVPITLKVSIILMSTWPSSVTITVCALKFSVALVHHPGYLKYRCTVPAHSARNYESRWLMGNDFQILHNLFLLLQYIYVTSNIVLPVKPCLNIWRLLTRRWYNDFYWSSAGELRVILSSDWCKPTEVAE